MKTLMIYLSLICILLGACSKDDLDISTSQEPENLVINDEVLSLIEQAKLNTNDVTTDILEHLDGNKEAVYVLEGDLCVTHKKLTSMAAHQHEEGEVHERQYRTDELVDNNQTIKVLGWKKSGNSASLSGDMRTALGWAINNYNNLDIGLDFDLTIGHTSDFDDYDIVVFQVFNNKAGGSAGFPVNGNPHKWVRIFNLTEGYSNNVIEHVITHEIGHSLGLRHTDWATRASCGSTNPENSGSIGANHISGTPTGYDSNSIMLACFNTQEDGEFGAFDRVALEQLYPD